MFRVSRQGGGIDDADTIEGARGIVRGQPASRYDVDKIRAEPFPSGPYIAALGSPDPASRWAC